MYHYNLKISLFTKDDNLMKIIETIEPCDKFSHEVQMFERIDHNVVMTSDVLVFDCKVDLNKIKEIAKKNAKIVLCTDEPIKHSDLSIANEIIRKSLDVSYIKYRMENLLERISLEADLHFQKECLGKLLQTIPDMVWFKDVEGIHHRVNDRFCEVVGKSKEKVEGQDHYSIWNVSKDDPNSGAEECQKTEMAVILANDTKKFQEYVKIADQTRELDTYKTPIVDMNGDFIGTVGFGHDVTNLKYLSAENSIFFEKGPYPVLIRNSKGIITNVNSQFENVFAVTKANMVGISYEQWSRRTFYPQRIPNNSGFVEGKTKPINGEEKILELRIIDIPGPQDKMVGQMCIFRDFTLERYLENKALQESITDPMTGLYNRRYFNDYMQKRVGNVTFLSVDLDHFKEVNDNYGHDYGDAAIILTANILKKSFPQDTIVRMGGDEFLVIKVGNEELVDIKKETEKFLLLLSNGFEESYEFIGLSASVGIAQGCVDNGFEALLKRSDNALYQAKEAGRACYYIDNNDVRLLEKKPEEK